MGEKKGERKDKGGERSSFELLRALSSSSQLKSVCVCVSLRVLNIVSWP